MKKIIILLQLSLLLASSAFAQITIEAPSSVEQGQAFLVKISSNQSTNKFTIEWNKKKFDLTPKINAENYELDLVLAMAVDATIDRELKVTGANEQVKTIIKPQIVNWPEQSLQVEPKYVSPPKEVSERIARESEKNKKILATISENIYWDLPFFRPVSGIVTSSFGGKRVFNSVPKSQHTGVDLRAGEGASIYAAANGKVVLAENQYYSGNIVYLDHGQGMYTLYAHQSKILVKVGDMVEKGQLIGYAGSTGRVTGPHLHLGLHILGNSVNALSIIE